MDLPDCPPGTEGYEDTVTEVTKKIPVDENCTKDFQEHLNSLKIKLENGETRCMVERRGRDTSGRWIYLCYPCAAMCRGESTVQTHISGKKHKLKIAMKNIWAMSVFTEHPYILSEKGGSSKTGGAKEKIHQKKAEETDHHNEETIDNVTAPPVGPEDLVEHPPEEAHYYKDEELLEHLNSLKIKLENGETRCMAERVRDKSGKWIYLCYPCAATCSGERTLQTHISGKKHKLKIATKNTWAMSIFTEHPYILSEKGGSSSKTGGAKEKILQKKAEEVDLPSEEPSEKDQKSNKYRGSPCHIEDTIDNVTTPPAGLEDLEEHPPEEAQYYKNKNKGKWKNPMPMNMNNMHQQGHVQSAMMPPPFQGMQNAPQMGQQGLYDMQQHHGYPMQGMNGTGIGSHPAMVHTQMAPLQNQTMGNNLALQNSAMMLPPFQDMQNAPQMGHQGMQNAPPMDYQGMQNAPPMGYQGMQNAPQMGYKGMQNAPQMGYQGMQDAPQMGHPGMQNAPQMGQQGWYDMHQHHGNPMQVMNGMNAEHLNPSVIGSHPAYPTTNMVHTQMTPLQNHTMGNNLALQNSAMMLPPLQGMQNAPQMGQQGMQNGPQMGQQGWYDIHQHYGNPMQAMNGIGMNAEHQEYLSQAGMVAPGSNQFLQQGQNQMLPPFQGMQNAPQMGQQVMQNTPQMGQQGWYNMHQNHGNPMQPMNSIGMNADHQEYLSQAGMLAPASNQFLQQGQNQLGHTPGDIIRNQAEQEFKEYLKSLTIKLKDRTTGSMVGRRLDSSGNWIYLCFPCAATCQDEGILKDHLSGKKHKIKITMKTIWATTIYTEHPFIMSEKGGSSSKTGGAKEKIHQKMAQEDYLHIEDTIDNVTTPLVGLEPLVEHPPEEDKTEQDFQEHLNSLKIELENGEMRCMVERRVDSSGKGIYLCYPCAATCCGEKTLKTHISGKKHETNVAMRAIWAMSIFTEHPYILSEKGGSSSKTGGAKEKILKKKKKKGKAEEVDISNEDPSGMDQKSKKSKSHIKDTIDNVMTPLVGLEPLVEHPPEEDKTEQEFQEHLKSLKIELENGETRCLVERRGRDISGKWIYLCYPCAAMCIGESMLKTHISGKKHKLKIAMKNTWAMSIFTEHPYILSEKGGSSSKTGGAKEKIVQKKAEEVDLPSEDSEKDQKSNKYRGSPCHIEDTIDNVTTDLVGLEPLVEHPPEEDKEFQEHLKRLKIELENGETRCMVERRGRDISGMWIYLCYPCAAMCTGESMLKTHISGEKHKSKIAIKNTWAKSVFTEHPYILSEKGGSSSKTGGAKEKILQKKAEKVGLPNEEHSEMDQKYQGSPCHIKDTIDNVTTPPVGLEPLVEHPPEEDKTKQEFQEHLKSLKIELENGETRCMVERRGRDISGKWIYLCYPCAAMCTGDSMLKTHISGKKHKLKIAMKNIWAMSIFTEHPYILSEKGGSSRKTGRAKKKIIKRKAEEVDLPNEDPSEMDQKSKKYRCSPCHIKDTIDNVTTPLVGLEPLVEHPPEEDKTEQEFQEHLKSLKIELENGETRCMVERRGRDISGKWIYLCYPCEAMCIGESMLKTHISGKKHKLKIATKNTWAMSIFTEHPYILSEKGGSSSKTGGAKKIKKRKTEEVDLPNEDPSEMDQKSNKHRGSPCHIKDTIDNVTTDLVGLEPLVEHPPEEDKYSKNLIIDEVQS